jgi:hypothetical protein
MTGMNGKRIIVGGLVAGVVTSVIEFGMEPLMGNNMEEWLNGLGLKPPTEGAMMGLVGLAFLVGTAAVWLYAAIRPRFGAGPRTALVAGVAMWALTCLIPNLAMAGFGLLTGKLLFLATVIPLVEMPLATLAGAWAYREASVPVETTRIASSVNPKEAVR